MRYMHLLVALAATVFTHLAHPEWLLKPVTEQVKAGEPLEVVVFLVNDTDKPIAEGLPARLPADARGATSAATITLEAVDPPADLGAPIAPGAFRKQTYRARVPLELQGPVQISLERLPESRLYVQVEGTRPEKPRQKTAAAAGPEPVLRVDTIPEPALSPYEPMYFLVGTRGEDNARFQLSFKYRLFDERSVPAQFLPGLSKLHFGFTQTSLWDIGGESSPFRDTSYRPSLFYHDPQLYASGGGRHVVGLDAGFEHESNGRDGERSRSINIAFVRPSWRWFVDDEHYFMLAPKVYAYLERSDNPDIGRYRGHVDLNLRYGKRDGWLFSGMYRRGTAGYESFQLDASYPIRQPFFANAGGYIHFQYFNGYGETLLDYNIRRSSQFRVGFSIVR